MRAAWRTLKSYAGDNMPKMDVSSLKAVLDSEKRSAMSADDSGKLSIERTKAIKYYMGDMADDMPTQEGQSEAISTDVADTIDGMMPALMEIFCGGDEVVRFDPVGPEDVAAAEQETDYVNHVFMQQNPGFLILFSMIKDALLQKTGIVKVDWDKREEETEETYYDMDDQQFALLVSDPSVEVIEHTTKSMPGDGPDATPETDPAYT